MITVDLTIAPYRFSLWKVQRVRTLEVGDYFRGTAGSHDKKEF